MMKEGESKYVTLGFNGSENPSQLNGFSTWSSVSLVMSQLENGVDVDFSEYAGYKIVGLNFGVAANLGEKAGALAVVYQSKTDQDGTELGTPYLVENKDYTVSTIEGNQLNLQWNSVAFTEAYEITGEEYAFLYGLAYEQVKGDGTSQEEFPFLTGVSEDNGVAGMFLAYGQPSSKYQEGMYMLNNPDDTNSEKRCLCMQLILETPGGATVILGLNGSDKPVAVQYYSLDGKKLSAPQKGINVVKMSDGTSKKVLVK